MPVVHRREAECDGSLQQDGIDIGIDQKRDVRADAFDAWLNGLKDRRGKARILIRLLAAEQGHFGDCAPVGEGISEMRIHIGPGYRVYFTRRGETVYLLLAGGDKASQRRDIAMAKALARSLPAKGQL